MKTTILAFLHVKVLHGILRVNECHDCLPHVYAFNGVRHLILLDFLYPPSLLDLYVLSLVLIVHLEPIDSCVRTSQGCFGE